MQASVSSVAAESRNLSGELTSRGGTLVSPTYLPASLTSAVTSPAPSPPATATAAAAAGVPLAAYSLDFERNATAAASNSSYATSLHVSSMSNLSATSSSETVTWLWQLNVTETDFPFDVSIDPFTANDSAFDATISFDEKYALWQATLIVIVIGVVILFIVLGNGLVILAIAVDRNLGQVQNYFIGSLAVSDLLLGLLVMPLSLTYELTGHWFFGDIVCDLWLCTDVLLCTASILHLCLISLDRYWSITRAVSYAQWRTAKRAVIMITVVWALSTVICLPPLVGWKRPHVEEDERGRQACALSSEKGYVAYSVLGSFYAPLFVMVVVYVKIYFAARSRARRNLKKKPAKRSEASAPLRGDKKESLSIEAPLKCTVTSLVLPAVADDACTWADYETTTCWDQSGERDSGGEGGIGRPVVREDSILPLTDDASTAAYSSYVTSPALLSPSDSNGHVMGGGATIDRQLAASPSDYEAHGNHGLVTSFSADNGQWRSGRQLQHRPSDSRSLQPLLSLVESQSNVSNISQLAGPQRNKTGSLASVGLHRTSRSSSRSKLTREYILSALGKGRRGTGEEGSGSGGKGGNSRPLSLEEERQRAKRLLAKQRERRATIVLGIVMVTFILCWLPFFISYPLSTFLDLKVSDHLFAVFFWAGYCNSAMNPIIYTIFNRDFRHAFQRVLHIRRAGP